MSSSAPAPAVASWSCDAAVIGGGPAGLMAAEVLARAGLAVHVFDAMPSVGRKFLLAGKGGLNLTHSEPLGPFVGRFGDRAAVLAPWLEDFGPDALRSWARDLGVETFVGTSGRVFPTDMKAAPLLRAWLHRLRGMGVRLHMRHRWQGAATPLGEGGRDGHSLGFSTPAGEVHVTARAAVLALGGASWRRLGSDGAWAPWLAAQGVPVSPLKPANCGFDVLGPGAPADETRREFLQALIGREPAPPLGWTAYFAERFAGQPFKSVALHFTDSQGRAFHRRGEFVATASGVEGSLVYAVSALLRDEIAAHGHATFFLDLLPDHTPERVEKEVRHPRGARSLGSHLKSRLGLDSIKTAILHEQLGKDGVRDAHALARAIKALPVTVVAPRPLDEAISTAGGVAFDGLDARLMLAARPGVFCAGEMLDWEAPTGGYLLTACMATGAAAGQGAAQWLRPEAD
ncbi:TIGR03862 family flavoprotein [Acidovorax sp. NCPPB 2350]|nr:TIGR03862 family flavoprotein [Acidovorax sp. NCPPB 2350]